MVERPAPQGAGRSVVRFDPGEPRGGSSERAAGANPKDGGSRPPRPTNISNGPVAQRQSTQRNELGGREFDPPRALHPKLFAIGRRDLAPGLRAAQLGHALVDYSLAFPAALVQWHGDSNNLVLLEVDDQDALAGLLARALEAGVTAIPVYEPDLAGQLTAIALGPEARQLVRTLPLAFR